MSQNEFELALKALKEGQFEDAVLLFEKAVEKEKGNPELLVYLGLSYLQAENPEKAIEVLSQVDEEFEDHCIVAQFLGRAYKVVRDYDSAELYLTKAITLEPDLYEAWCDLGEVLYFTHQHTRAVQILENAIQRFPNDPLLHSILAMSWYRLGDYTEAAREWALVSKLKPNSIVALGNYAYTLLLLNRIDEAKPIIEAACKIAPDRYRPIMLTAELYFRQNKYDEALDYFLQALEKCPYSIEALSRLAVLYDAQGDSEKTEYFLDRMIELLSCDPQAWQRTCDVYLHLRRFDEHLALLEKTIENGCDSPAAWISLAIEYTRRGLVEKARSAWHTSVLLRGYVKCYCNECNSYSRMECPPKFDFSFPIYCPSCGKLLPLPESLSVV